MMTDIFDFWDEVGPADRVHPADSAVLNRVKHDFDPECLPAPFGGPLRAAKVVLLYLSPALSMQDREEADDTEVQNYFMGQRNGRELFRTYGGGFDWLTERIKCFGDREQIWPHLAKLNICAYHSTNFKHTSLLASLPSCRVSIGWAQDILFPQAERGERVVICLRSARFWGLKEGEQYGRSLFAPPVTIGGHMRHGTMRERIIEAVQSAIEISATKKESL